MGGLLCSPSLNQNSYTINGRKYLSNSFLGEGGFAMVYLVKDGSGRKYALKKMICQTEESLEIANKEINTMLNFNHPNIIKLIDHVIIDSKKLPNTKEVLMLTPYYREGTLQDILDRQRISFGKDYSKGVFTEKKALEMFLEICEAIEQLHSHQPRSMSHRDIKPGNILISDQNRKPILTDFGSVCEGKVHIQSRKEALSLQDQIEMTTTPFYRAPELFDIQSNVLIDERTDIWALGCLLYAIAFNRSPFEVSPDEKSTSVQLTVLNGLPNQFPNQDYSLEFCNLIRSMCDLESSKRPFINQIINETKNLLNS